MISGRGGDAEKSREEPGRTQELGGSWESREEREKHKCGLEENKSQNAEPKNIGKRQKVNRQ